MHRVRKTLPGELITDTQGAKQTKAAAWERVRDDVELCAHCLGVLGWLIL